MKKRHASRLRLQTETIRSLDATRRVAGAGLIFATRQACTPGGPNTQDGSTLTGMSLVSVQISCSPQALGSLICG
jgi:hypothetical protein